ncbi:GatB/YqeY domain-containing protein [Massilia sp. H-1]|nr:GatB/YqeY domain-containing protein [Massilia sp. H-1]
MPCAKEAGKLGTIRLIIAEIKRKEVDERIDVTDEQALAIVEKMIKQRKDSISQFEAGGRQDLADIEKSRAGRAQCLHACLGLSEEQIAAEVAAAVTASGAAGPQDMGKVMAILKPKMPKGTDMGAVSALIKKALAPAA